MSCRKTIRIFVIFSFLLIFLWPKQTLATTVSDNFNRADGMLGSNWTTVTGTNAPKIVSNVLEPGTSSSLNAAYWSANSFTSDQFVQASMPNSIGSEQGPGIAVRMANSRGYFLWFGNSSNSVSIWRMDSSSSWTQLVASNTLTVSGSDVWKFVVQGTSLKGYQNGTLVVSTTDSTYSDGSPGVWMFNNTNQIDDWSGGDDATYSVGGIVSGLSGTVTLENNSGDDLNVISNGSFTFNTTLNPGDTYNVTVKSNPAGQTCTSSNGSGTISASAITSVSISCTNSSSSLPASDDFNRSNGLLGTNWTDFTGGALSITSQMLTSPSGTSGAIRTEESYTNDQYSEIQTTATGPSSSNWIGPSVRTQNGGQDMYLGIYFNNGGTFQLKIYKRISGTFTALSGAYNCGLLPLGTKLRIVVIGSTVVFLENGVERLTAHDTNLTNGSPGIVSFGNGNQADNWSGDDAANFMVNYLSTDTNGVESYDVISETNGPGAQTLRVLRPTSPAAGVRHSFIYVLPVEAGLGTTYGDGLDTLRALDAQDQYNLTIIEPTFGIEPWYADNPSNSDALQETFMTTQLVPWVNDNLETTGYEQSWMIGFSKSGLGGMDLFLKHPDLFTLEAAWDWPADISTYNQFGSSSSNIYGTDANFQTNYRLTSSFMDAHKSPFITNNRIWIGGYNAFQTDVADFDTLLTTKGMIHTAETPTSMLHRWDSGWVPLALAALYQDSINLPDTTAPTITAFTIPSTSTSLAVSISSFTAKDNIGVTGYNITESATPPSVNDIGWSSIAPTFYTTSCGGTKRLYAWAKDAAGNISTSLTTTVTISGSCTSTSSSTSSSNSSGQSSPNAIPGWSKPIMAGPHYFGNSSYISGTGNAQTFIGVTAVHADVNVRIDSISPTDLEANAVPFPWAQGLNTAGEIFNFKVVSAFNGYPMQTFDKPVTIIVPYDPKKIDDINYRRLAIATYDPMSKKWILLPYTTINSQNHTLATTVKQFSYFVVVYTAKNIYPQITSKTINTNATIEPKPTIVKKIYTQEKSYTSKKQSIALPQKQCFLFICW